MPAIDTQQQRDNAIKGKTLTFIGDANWDLYAQPDGRLWAIPKPDCLGCHMSPFGDRHHVKRLMDKGYFTSTPTDAGLALMEGLYTRLVTDSKGKRFGILGFDIPDGLRTAFAA